MTHMQITRRNFLVTTAAAGGGLMLGFFMPGANAATRIAAQPWTPPTDKEGQEVNAWLVIDPDGTITIRVAQSEMGQGVFTAMPMIVAEELHCDWNRVVAEYASANRSIRENNVYERMATNASRAVKNSRPYLQQAGASARERLKEAAAQAWGVPRSQVAAQDSVLSSGNRSGTFAEFATAAAGITLEEEPTIKTPDQYWLLGRAVNRIDVPLKVDGKAIYGIDINLPGMLYAASMVSPVAGGTVRGIREDSVMGLPGVVKVVEFGQGNTNPRFLRNGVAVVADTWWHAKTALDQLSVDWDLGDGVRFNSTEIYQSDLAALEEREGAVVFDEGDTFGVMAGATQVVEATYSAPMQAHGCMEPMNCVAQVTPSRVDIWMGTQDPTGGLAEASEVAEISPESCFVHNCFLGGGYGGRGSRSEVGQAVSIAKELDGRPVKLLWSREVDLPTSNFDPSAVVKFRAGLGPDGMPIAWWGKMIGDSIFGWVRPSALQDGVDRVSLLGLADMAYNFPNKHLEYIIRQTNVPITFMRAPGYSHNSYFVEAFMDEMAAAGGVDPVELRKKLLGDLPDWQDTLDTAVANSNWGQPLPEGSGRGVAIHDGAGTTAAAVAEVTIGRRGQLYIDRIDMAVDPGHLINKKTFEEQTIGSVVYGLSSALRGEITLVDGVVQQDNFDDYKIMRVNEMPPMSVNFSLSGGEKWGGGGESTVPTGIAAVANAIFNATGVPVRSLPFSHHDLTQRG